MVISGSRSASDVRRRRSRDDFDRGMDTIERKYTDDSAFGQRRIGLIAIGIDERVFARDSELHQKSLAYGSDFAQAHIIARSAQGRCHAYAEGNVVFHPVRVRYSFLFPWVAYRIGLRVMRERMDRWVVSADNPFEIGLVAFFLTRARDARLHLHVHTDFMSPFFRTSSWKERVRARLAKFVVPRADCLRVVSERVRMSLRELGITNRELPITVLPVFTDVKKFIHAVPDPMDIRRFRGYAVRMIAVGRFVDKEKNFSMLIDMMRELLRIFPTTLLVLAGEGPDKKNYELRITQHGLEKNIILEPWHDDLAAFYKSFDLFLLSSNYEGWGRVAVEAMAAGLTVVMTDVGLAGEVVVHERNGIIVPVGDQQAFLHAIKMLYEQPEKREKFARAAQQAVKNLKPATREEYLARYRESLEQKQGG